MTRSEKLLLAGAAIFALSIGGALNWWMFAVGVLGLAICLGLFLDAQQTSTTDAPPEAVAVVVDFLAAWRYCPLARSENASAGDLEDAAKQLLDALAEAERAHVDRHVRVALGLLRQAAPAIERERSTRLDGPLMSVLDARDELEKATAGVGAGPLYAGQAGKVGYEIHSGTEKMLAFVYAWSAEEAIKEAFDRGDIPEDTRVSARARG